MIRSALGSGRGGSIGIAPLTQIEPFLCSMRSSCVSGALLSAASFLFGGLYLWSTWRVLFSAGPPLAVDKLTWGSGDLPFEMTEKQAMIAGTELTGDVVVTARFDQDGDAISKQPGDVSGSVRVKIPADKVTLTLDDVLQ